MKRKKKLIFLVVILAVWLFLMLHLSSANGKPTLQESMALSEYLGKWNYQTPSGAQNRRAKVLTPDTLLYRMPSYA